MEMVLVVVVSRGTGGLPCALLGEGVHAFGVAEPGVRPAALKQHCMQVLADYKVPESFTLRDQPLPRNANGKLLKRELRGQTARAP